MSAPPESSVSPAGDLPLDDLLLEIFLRLPPEPNHLFAASLVCRRWRRLVRNPAFLRRFRALHGAPPLLGFFQNIWCVRSGSHIDTRRVVFSPVASALGIRIPPKPGHRALDCRRGRVLLLGPGEQPGLLVWDPMTGDAHHVSAPPGSQGTEVAAALVFAAGRDDHTYCQSTPFQIVFLDSRGNDNLDADSRFVSAHVYSSETDSWCDAATIWSPFGIDMDGASTVVGSSVYWNLELTTLNTNYILEFEMPKQRLALIELPPGVCQAYMSDIRVMPAEDGSGVGFVGVNCYSLHFWARKVVHEAAREWVLIRKINLGGLTISASPIGAMLLWSSVAAFSEGGDEIFLQSEGGIFAIDIRSLQLRKVLEATGLPIYPYARFYTRGRDIADIDDRDNE